MDDHHSHMRRGFNWLGSATIVARLIDFATTLAVLWFLTKQEVGVASLVMSITVIIEAVDGLGIREALVQAKSVSREQLDSAFWFVITVAVLAGGLILLVAPLIERLYGVTGMAIYFVAVAAKLPFVGGALVPGALLNRQLKYERIAVVSISATFAAAITRLIIATLGGGVWAFVAGDATHGLYTLIGTQIALPFVPRLRFRLGAIRDLLRFGIRAATSNGLQQLFRNADFLLIGWFYGPSPLAIYRLAFDTAMEPAVAIGTLVNRTVLPVFARIYGAGEPLGPAFSWSVGRVAVLVGPLMVAFILGAGPIASLVHDANGLSYADAALPLKILAAAALLRALFQLLYPLMLSTGSPGTAVRLAATTLVLLVAGIWTAGTLCQSRNGIIAMSGVWLAIYPLLLVWGARYVARNLAMPVSKLTEPLVVPLVAAINMTAAVELVRVILRTTQPLAQLALVAVALACTYFCTFLYTRRQPAPGN